MVAVNIPVKSSTAAGINLGAMTAGDATNYNSFANSGSTLLIAKNTGATPRSAVLVTPKTVSSLAVADRTIGPIPAGETWSFGPYDVDTYGATLTVQPAHAELTFWAIEP